MIRLTKIEKYITIDGTEYLIQIIPLNSGHGLQGRIIDLTGHPTEYNSYNIKNSIIDTATTSQYLEVQLVESITNTKLYTPLTF